MAALSPWSRVALLLILLGGLTLRWWHGSFGLEYGRFWDELYGFRNVRAVYLTGELWPHHAFYPSPVWSVPLVGVMKASDLLHQKTGDPDYEVLDPKTHPTPTGFRLGRGLQAVYGTAAVLFLFLVGRRMFSARVGLIAALLLAFAPWPVHTSAYVKPDALLLMLTVLAWYASVVAVEKRTVPTYLAAGVAIALAMSAKLTGGLIALCLIAATLVLGWRDRRRWLLLAVAGATSALAFVLLNPAWRHYLQYLAELKDEYAGHADRAGVTRGVFFSKLLEFLTGDFLNGLLIGGLGLLGLVLLAVSLWTRRHRLGSRSRAQRLMLVIFPLVFPVAYVAQTPHFKANNLQPVALFTMVAAAWMLASGWQWAAERWQILRRPAMAGVAFLALVAWVVPGGFLYVYRTYTPSTRDAALRAIDDTLESRHARLIYAERGGEPEPPWWSRRESLQQGLSAVRWVDRLDQVPPEQLALSDAVLVDANRLVGPEASFYLGLGKHLPPDRLSRMTASAFERRGPAVVYALFTPRHRSPNLDLDLRPCESREPSCGGCLEAELPADPNPRLSYNFYAYFSASAIGESRVPPRAELGRRTLELVHASRRPERGDLFVTPRFRLDGDADRVRFCRDEAFGDGQIKIQRFRWAPSL